VHYLRPCAGNIPPDDLSTMFPESEDKPQQPELARRDKASALNAGKSGIIPRSYFLLPT